MPWSPPPTSSPRSATTRTASARVAAANSLSDVYAMGGKPLFALNLCCFPELEGEGAQALAGVLRGAAEALVEAGAVLLGGHSVRDPELKFGLAVIGEADRDRLLTNAGARPGDRLLLTKPLGTGVLDQRLQGRQAGRGRARARLREMERLNDVAAAWPSSTARGRRRTSPASA